MGVRMLSGLAVLMGAAACAATPVVPSAPTSMADLEGRSFALERLSTDTGGGRYRLDDDARMVMTFGVGSAKAETHCGVIDYAVVRQLPDEPSRGLQLEFGNPTGTDCRMGPDPAGTQINAPAGMLMVGVVPGTEYLSLTDGTIGWYLREI